MEAAQNRPIALRRFDHYQGSVPATEVSESKQTKIAIFGLSAAVCVAVALVLALVPKQPPAVGPSALASLNAALNSLAGCLLVAGFVLIRRGKTQAHRLCMLSAFSVSGLFLVTYLIHHAQVGSVPFQGQGAIRIVYFSVLIPHIILAAIIVPLALFTIVRGLSGRTAAHRKIARITLPIWLFVSFSGVALYFMLYHL